MKRNFKETHPLLSSLCFQPNSSPGGARKPSHPLPFPTNLYPRYSLIFNPPPFPFLKKFLCFPHFENFCKKIKFGKVADRVGGQLLTYYFILECKAPTLANACQSAKSKFWCCKEFELVVGVGVADVCLQLAAVQGSFY